MGIEQTQGILFPGALPGNLKNELQIKELDRY
jgi:hypothetical protein